MTTVLIPIFIAVLVFACGVGGLHMQRLLPASQSEFSREMISAILGLITLLLALVLGVTVGSAYGRFATQNTEMENLSARALQLDLALAEYGPETKPFRAKLKEDMSRSYQLFWGSGNDASSDPTALNVSAALPSLRAADEYLAGLSPQLLRSDKQPPQPARKSVRFKTSGLRCRSNWRVPCRGRCSSSLPHGLCCYFSALACGRGLVQQP